MAGGCGLGRTGTGVGGNPFPGRQSRRYIRGRRRRRIAEPSGGVGRQGGPERSVRQGAGGFGDLCGECHGGVLFSEGRTARRRIGQAGQSHPANADVGTTALPDSVSAGWWSERPGLNTVKPPEREPPRLPLAGPESCPRKPLAIELPAQRAGYRHPRGKLEPPGNGGEPEASPASGIAMGLPTGICFAPLQPGSTIDPAGRVRARIVRNRRRLTWSNWAIPS